MIWSYVRSILVVGLAGGVILLIATSGKADPATRSAQTGSGSSQAAGTEQEEGFEPLFPQDGAPGGWLVRRWNDVSLPADPGAAWKVVDGVLHGRPR